MNPQDNTSPSPQPLPQQPITGVNNNTAGAINPPANPPSSLPPTSTPQPFAPNPNQPTPPNLQVFANSPVIQPQPGFANRLSSSPMPTVTANNKSQDKTAQQTVPPKTPHNPLRSLLSTLSLFIFAPLIAWMIVSFGIQSYQVEGISMEQTLQDKDRLIVNKMPRSLARVVNHDYIPHRGDIIIFNARNLPDIFGANNKQLIKRVIGLPGERVVVKDDSITIYNSSKPLGFNPDQTVGYHLSVRKTEGNVDIRLGPDEIFVCGDNRPNSEDSRFFGPIKANDIVGKLILRLFPADKAQRF